MEIVLSGGKFGGTVVDVESTTVPLRMVDESMVCWIYECTDGTFNFTMIDSSEVLTTEQLYAIDLDVLKESIFDEINRKRDEIAKDKFIFDGIEWDSDDTARANVNDLYDAIILSGNILPAELETWRDYRNIDRTIYSVEYAFGMKIAMMRHFQTCHMVGRHHKEQISLLQTTEDVHAYNYSVGWPA